MMKFTGLLIKAGERTKNGRVYSKAAIEAAQASGGSKVAEGALVGAFYLPGEVPPEKIAISDIDVRVTGLFSENEGSELHAEVEALETFGGRYVVHANKCAEKAREEGRAPGIGKLVLRPCGTGTVLEDGTVGDDYVLKTVSLCLELEPSSSDFLELLKESEVPDDQAVMRTTPHWDRVCAFMVKAKQNTPDRPVLPSEDVRRLRASLILEEALETVEALGFVLRVDDYEVFPKDDAISFASNDNASLEGIADGCADLSVVNVGTLIACGVRDDRLLSEVDRNNLAKFGPGHSYREDGKLVKPPDHQSPDIKKVLREQGWDG